MAKKKKNAILNSVMSTNTDMTALNNTVSSDVYINKDVDTSLVTSTIIYDDVSTSSDELIKMSNANSELTDKLAEYIDEIKKLKDEISKLNEENDKHLMKIAELSFENATLMSKIDLKNDTSKNIHTTVTNTWNSKKVNYPSYGNFNNRSGLNTGDYWN
jgi:predicted nuclease with TOPRIM domain